MAIFGDVAPCSRKEPTMDGHFALLDTVHNSSEVKGCRSAWVSGLRLSPSPQSAVLEAEQISFRRLCLYREDKLVSGTLG